MEEVVIRGVTLQEEAKVTVTHLADHPGVAARLFRTLAENKVNVDMIIQNASEKGFTDISFTVSKPDIERARSVIENNRDILGAGQVKINESIAKVSVVGIGMRSHAGVAADMFDHLANEGINIEMISTSEIKISCVVSFDEGKKAVSVLHAAFGLGE